MSGVAIVTGGGSGIGRSAALALAGAGWQVVICGRRAAALAQTCELADGDIIAITADVTSEPSVDRLFAQTAKQYGRIDLLFNNAGSGHPPNPIGDVALADWKAVIDANVTGAFLCARAAFRQMSGQSPRGGRIINNGSIAAHVPRPQAVAYTVSKHAITGLTRALALEGRAMNIACGQIDIGNAATDMTGAFTQGTLQADGSIAVEPVMDIANVAASVVHMAGLPLDANVQFMTILATSMPYIGRG